MLPTVLAVNKQRALRELQTLVYAKDHQKVGKKTGHQEETHKQAPAECLAAHVPVTVLEVRSLNLQAWILGILHVTQKLYNRTTKKV